MTADADAESAREALAPDVTDAGAKDAVTPAGSPEADNATVWAEPNVVAVVTVADADAPAATDTELGATPIEKSLVGPPTIECEIAHAPLSFDHVPCIANEPLANATFCAPPVPPVPTHAHLSAFSAPDESVQPPAGFWSVIVSAYSCPATIVTPSSAPAAPAFT